jgi:hypothetical protein
VTNSVRKSFAEMVDAELVSVLLEESEAAGFAAIGDAADTGEFQMPEVDVIALPSCLIARWLASEFARVSSCHD